MKKTKLVTALVASLSLPLAVFAQTAEHSETVDQGKLPEAVQKTIKEHAAGGDVVRVQREDDNDGRWNYEVVVKSNGKEWGFEINHQGKFVRKHDSLPK